MKYASFFSWRPAQKVTPAHGFTLIETLVTVAIIGFLAILLLPTLSKMQAGAGAAKCAGNLKQIGAAVVLYAGEHNLTLPPGTEYTDKTNPDGSLMGDPKVNKDVVFPADYADLGMKPWKLFACPTDRSRERWQNYTSYAQNVGFFISYTNGKPSVSNANPNGRPIRLEEAQKKILFCDGITQIEADSWTEGWPLPNVNGNGVAGALLSYFANSTISKRHNGNVNCLFGDGSVRFMRKAEACKPEYLDRNES